MKTNFLPFPIDFRLVSYRLEIGILHLAIDLLSDSKLLQQLITGACRLIWQATQFLRKLDAHLAARWAAAGLCIGFFIALVSAYLTH